MSAASCSGPHGIVATCDYPRCTSEPVDAAWRVRAPARPPPGPVRPARRTDRPAAAPRPPPLLQHPATTYYGRGVANAATGNLAAGLRRTRRGHRGIRPNPHSRYPFNDTVIDTLAIAAEMLSGEIAYRRGGFDAPFADLRRAIGLDDALPRLTVRRLRAVALSDDDLSHLGRCVQLAREALDGGDEPFGWVLVDDDGRRLFEDRDGLHLRPALPHVRGGTRPGGAGPDPLRRVVGAAAAVAHRMGAPPPWRRYRSTPWRRDCGWTGPWRGPRTR